MTFVLVLSFAADEAVGNDNTLWFVSMDTLFVIGNIFHVQLILDKEKTTTNNMIDVLHKRWQPMRLLPSERM